jgi:hypothetical protein
MGMDYSVAIHAADSPTPAALNRCMSDLRYPVALSAASPSGMDRPLAIVPGTAGLVAMFEGQRVELETSIRKLGPGSPYAYGLGPDMPTQESTLPDGTQIISRRLEMPRDSDPKDLKIDLRKLGFVPKDLNTDLRELGVPSPDYQDGDYVITLTFRSPGLQHPAGFFLLAALIRCADGLGFEFQAGLFGKADFADGMAQYAADPQSRQ